MVSKPDHIQNYGVEECSHRQRSLKDTEVVEHKKRQVFDIPPLKLEVTEHQAEVIKCSHFGLMNTSQFTEGVIKKKIEPRITRICAKNCRILDFV